MTESDLPSLDAGRQSGSFDEELFRQDPRVRAVAAQFGGPDIKIPKGDPTVAAAEIIRRAESDLPTFSAARRLGAALRGLGIRRRARDD